MSFVQYKHKLDLDKQLKNISGVIDSAAHPKNYMYKNPGIELNSYSPECQRKEDISPILQEGLAKIIRNAQLLEQDTQKEKLVIFTKNSISFGRFMGIGTYIVFWSTYAILIYQYGITPLRMVPYFLVSFSTVFPSLYILYWIYPKFDPMATTSVNLEYQQDIASQMWLNAILLAAQMEELGLSISEESAQLLRSKQKIE